MEPFIFYGVVLPERAQLSHNVTVGFTHVTTGVEGTATVSIVLNQVAVWLDGEHEWDIFDLRNLVKYLVQCELDIIGYFKGHAYDFQITRVLKQSRGIDHVFGIDIPCIVERNKHVNLELELTKLRDKIIGPNSVFLNRCFNDLVSAMKNAEDTGFYCYRAIESLRHHCAAVNGLSDEETSIQWETFREVAGCTEVTLRAIKQTADPLRHGQIAGLTSTEREALFLKTWDVVDGYLQHI
jgi:hypothetical protein